MRLLGETLEVSPAGDSAWRGRPASAQQQRRDSLLLEIRAVPADVKARYGSPRRHAALAARGQDSGDNTVAKPMREHGIAPAMPWHWRSSDAGRARDC